MNWELLYKYVQGKCDKHELHKLGEWLQKDPANEDFFTSFVEGWNEKDEIDFESDDRAAWNTFKEHQLHIGIGDSQNRNTPQKVIDSSKRIQLVRKKKKRGIAFWAYSLVAAMMLIAAMFFVVRHHNMENNARQEVAISYQEISTVKGQRSNLKLSDGTKVVLNAGSTLRIPQNYGAGNRTLYLEGEAFFEVTHNEANPFVVISNQVYTKDLGTEFNISAYDSTSIEVAVKEGLVSIGKMADGTMQREIVEITPNKLGVLRKIGGLTISDIEDMDQYVGWTEGKLVFQRTPFTEVLRRLELWFDIECEVNGSLSDLSKRTLTATYDNMPMTELLQVMAISLKVSFERDGRTIMFTDTELLDSEK